VHVAARTEVAARALDHDAVHIGGVAQLLEQVAQFGVRRESQRVLAFRPVQRDEADAVLDFPGEVLGRVASQCHAVASGQGGIDTFLHGLPFVGLDRDCLASLRPCP
jgi:hypothetical protein